MLRQSSTCMPQREAICDTDRLNGGDGSTISSRLACSARSVPGELICRQWMVNQKVAPRLIASAVMA